MAIFIEDTFTEATNTNLTAHTPNVGGTWVQRNVSSGGTSRNLQVTGGTGNLNAISGDGLLTNSATPAGTDYSIELDWTPSSASFSAIPFNWTSEGTFYQLVLDRYSGEIRFERLDSWSVTSPLGTPYTVTMSNGVLVNVKIEVTVEGTGKRLKAFVNGVERINVLNDPGLSSVGLAAVRQDGGDISYYKAEDIGPSGFSITAEGGTYSLSGVAADLKTTRIITAEVGSYSWTGVDASLVKETPGAFVIIADAGSYLWTGTDAYRDLAFNAEGGVYITTGYDVSFTLTEPMAYTITAEAGTYTFSGRTVYLLGPGDTIPTATSSKLAINIGLRL